MLSWIFAAFAACFVLERLAPGWRLPAVQGWWWRVMAINVAQLAIVLIAGVSWERWAQNASLFHLPASWPDWAGGVFAYFMATFVFYWWHRARHEVQWLWLGFHQIRHSPQAGAVYTLCTALGEFFYHTNMRTPRWVGFVFQRPEMHRIHHEMGRHKNNYGDIVWWDMMFGTYENPPTWNGRCGYDGGREQRLGEMLQWRDVHR